MGIWGSIGCIMHQPMGMCKGNLMMRLWNTNPILWYNRDTQQTNLWVRIYTYIMHRSYTINMTYGVWPNPSHRGIPMGIATAQTRLKTCASFHDPNKETFPIFEQYHQYPIAFSHHFLIIFWVAAWAINAQPTTFAEFRSGLLLLITWNVHLGGFWSCWQPVVMIGCGGSSHLVWMLTIKIWESENIYITI